MRTDELIEALASQVEPVVYRPPRPRLLVMGIAGAGCSLLLMLTTLGLRPDISVAVGTGAFWIKWGYFLMLAAGAFWAVEQMARPDGEPVRALLPLIILGIVATLAVAAQLSRLDADEALRAWMGQRIIACPLRIMALSLPPFIALAWSFRQFMPTRLRLAGFLVGIFAGCIGAVAYALFCRQYSAAYVVSWYGVGVMLMGGIGALAGPRIFRW